MSSSYKSSKRQSVWHRYLWQWNAVVIVVPLISIVVILLRSCGLLESIELRTYDQFVRWKPESERDSRIVIVGINEADVRKVGNPIFPDQIYADVIAKLQTHQPRAIGLDIYRDQPIPPGNKQLNQVFQTYDNIIGITKIIGDSDKDQVASPPILQAKGKVGFNDIVFDQDNKIRRALLALPREQMFSFAMYLALIYLEAENITLHTTGNDYQWQLGKTIFVPFQNNDGGYHNADANGYQMMLNYRGNSGHFETVSLTDVLENKIPSDWGKNRIILIGFVGESFQDTVLTPYTRKASERMAGVEFHAHVISHILAAAIDQNRSNQIMIKTWSDSLENLWIISWAGIGTILAWRLRKSDISKREFLKRLLVLASTVLLLFGITYIAFLFSWWLPVIPSLLALSGSIITITIYIAYSAARIRHTFGRYLSAEIVNTLLESPQGIKLGGEKKKVTILTSDLRGFTSICDDIPPEIVVKILNFYLGYMANIITKYQGVIDEFMGDGILVLFGVPISKNDDAERAIACAIKMQLAMKSINKKMKKWGYFPLKMGIGINTGEVIVGNIGSEKRTKYGIVGSEVNLTYRIESYTIGGQIFISENTRQEIKTGLQIKQIKKVFPKGVKKPLHIYSINGIQGKYNLFLPQDKRLFVTLLKPLKIEYYLLNEKDISPQVYYGQISKLSPQGAEICMISSLYLCPDYLTNLKLVILGQKKQDHIYGKVINHNLDKNCFQVHFTHLPLHIATKLNLLYEKNNHLY